MLLVTRTKLMKRYYELIGVFSVGPANTVQPQFNENLSNSNNFVLIVTYNVQKQLKFIIFSLHSFFAYNKDVTFNSSTEQALSTNIIFLPLTM